MYRSVLVFLLTDILQIMKFAFTDTLIKNTKQTGKVMTILQPSGIQMCAKYCFCESRCQSFNFEQETLTCELLPTEDVASYINKKGYIHGNIVEWSKDSAGKCGRNHCSLQERYVPLENGGATCIKIGCAAIQYTYDNDTGLCYRIYQEKKSWAEASEYCQNKGGRLIVLDTLAKLTYFPPSNHNTVLMYIGLTDTVTEGMFKWVTGSNLTHHKFRADQPNDVDTGYPDQSADCVSSRGDYWYDHNCKRPLAFACERADLSPK